MTPFFFGSAPRRLFAILQPSQGPAAATAALLCNPYGQEAVRTHRMYRVLADRLARDGVDVMRFDYYATGDSAGDDADGDLEGWIGDLVEAHEELRRRSPGARVVWIGTRLGATLAIQATVRTTHPPARLVLWEPIVDGAAYVDALAARFLEALESGYDVPSAAWRRLQPTLASRLEREGIGFEIGDTLRAQLRALDASSLCVPRGSQCIVVEPPSEGRHDALLAAWRRAGVDTRVEALQHDFDWMAAEALSTALVPAPAVQLLGRLAREPR